MQIQKLFHPIVILVGCSEECTFGAMALTSLIIHTTLMLLNFIGLEIFKLIIFKMYLLLQDQNIKRGN